MAYLMTNKEVLHRAELVAARIQESVSEPQLLYGVPRGGVPAAYAISSFLSDSGVVDSAERATVIIDDIIDSGKTRDEYRGKGYPHFYALVNRTEPKIGKEWIVFPWEDIEEHHSRSSNTGADAVRNALKSYEKPYTASDNIDVFSNTHPVAELRPGVERAVGQLLKALMIDLDHNTEDTAKRVAKMYLNEVFKGRYIGRPEMTAFPNTRKLDQILTVGPISVRSCCAHHLVPVIGEAWIGVLLGDKMMGLSKYNRLTDWIMSRPHTQEEATVMLADALEEVLAPQGMGIVVKAQHMCLSWRGVKDNGWMVTSVMRGKFQKDESAKREFFELIKSHGFS